MTFTENSKKAYTFTSSEVQIEELALHKKEERRIWELKK